MNSRKSLLRELKIHCESPITSSIYPPNKLRFTKHSWLTFIPKSLFEQFQRVANIWFVLISVFQLLPYHLNPTDSWTTIAPLSVLIMISLTKDLYNGYLLSKKLKKLNESGYGIWNGSKFTEVKSQDIKVGQIILLNANDLIPADIIILSRTNPTDSIFLDMTNLLGSKSCVKKYGLDKIEKSLGIGGEVIDLVSLTGVIKIPEPNADYNNFLGNFKLEGHPSASNITLDNMLFSGARIKGCEPVIGFVAYCGHESKMMLNTEIDRKKYSRIEDYVNRSVLYILIFLAVIVLGSVIGYFLNPLQEPFDFDGSPVEIIIIFTLLYSNLVPISLFVSIDIIKILQGFVFRNKYEGYWFNTDDLNDNLGQVEYLVTDKTSTFTKDSARVKFIVLNDVIFENPDNELDMTPHSERLLISANDEYRLFADISEMLIGASQNQIECHLLKSMCLCNSLTFANNEYLGLEEEITLVKTAEDLGYKLELDAAKKASIYFQSSISTFTKIAMLSNKASKKFQVLVEDSIGNCGVFYTRSSPEAMLKYLNISGPELDALKLKIAQLEHSNCQVLLFTYKVLTHQEITEYQNRVHRIEKSLLNTRGKIQSIFRQLEKNMKLLGLVGIKEDLQDKSKETFQRILKSGIKVWLASSDSYEYTSKTAREIGLIDNMSLLDICGIKSEQTLIKYLTRAVKNLILERNDQFFIQKTYSKAERIDDNDDENLADEEVHTRPEAINNEFFRAITYNENNADDILNKPFDPFGIDFTVIIDRVSFNIAVNNEKCRKFLVCVLACAKSVCFVELMPREKANVVKLLKENFKFSPCVAAIGSGEGDINMMQLADIGIAVKKNNESLFANYSDIVVDRFSKIDQLLLVEGHYSYSRMAKVILLFLYKNCLLTLVQLAYMFLCGFSGNSIDNSSLFVGFNIFFTTLPIFWIGVYDEDIHYTEILNRPQLYSVGIYNSYFNWRHFLKYFISSFIQGAILALFCFKMDFVIFKNGHSENFYADGTLVYITIIITVLLQILIDTNSFNRFYCSSLFTSVFCLIIFLIIESSTDFPDSTLYGVGVMISESPFSLFTIFFTSLSCIIPSLFYSTYQGLFNSSLLEKLKSNFDISTDENKIFWFKNSLLRIYKTSNSWKSKLEQVKFQTSKFSLQFKLPHIENKYADNFIREHINQFKFFIVYILILQIVHFILTITVFSSNTDTIIVYTVILAGECIFIYILFTSHFLKHFRLYSIIAIMSAIFTVFAIEITKHETYYLSTAYITAILFLLFSVNFVYMLLLASLNLLVFIISVSVQFSKHNSSNVANDFVSALSSVVIFTSISLTLAIQGYYCKKSRRTEYELINTLKSTIEKSDSILSIMFPPFVRKKVKNGIRYIAEDKKNVTIIFCDIGNFEKICKEYSPFELTRFLDSIFSKFDTLCENIGVTKIETVGKTYMACAGLVDSDINLPQDLRKENHGRRAVEFGLAILQEIADIQLKNENFLQVKIGINSGTVSAGVVGQHKPQFSLVGDTVNTASRMCSTLESYNSIQISDSTYELVRGYREYKFTSKIIEAKGKGKLNTYIVTEKVNDSFEVSGGVSNGLSIGKIQSNTCSFMSEKAVLDSETPNRGSSRFSKTWEEQLFQNHSKAQLISNTPALCSLLPITDQEELKFRKQNLAKNELIYMSSLVISVVNFGLLLILSILYVTLNGVFSLQAIIRAFVFILLVLYLLFNKYLYHRRNFIIAYLFTCFLMQVVPLLFLEIYNDVPTELAGIEIIYIIVLIAQVPSSTIFILIISNMAIITSWLIVIAVNHTILDHLLNILIVIGFSAVNINAKYSQEKHDRTNYNLKHMADKEIRETQDLLIQMMPPHVLEYLEDDKVIHDRLLGVTLIYADIVGFTDWSSNKKPNEIVEMLSNLFTKFDNLCVEYDVYKVHTIGDCYVVMGYTGKKQRNPSEECLNVIKMAYRMIEVINEENLKHSSKLNMRIGVHTGEVIAGVIGTSIVRYDIWGPDVLIANKMESNGKPGYIKVSVDTKEMIKSREVSGLSFEESSNVEISSLGISKQSYFLDCKDINLIAFE